MPTRLSCVYRGHFSHRVEGCFGASECRFCSVMPRSFVCAKCTVVRGACGTLHAGGLTPKELGRCMLLGTGALVLVSGALVVFSVLCCAMYLCQAGEQEWVLLSCLLWLRFRCLHCVSCCS
jgi:hypothetical protein